MKLSLQKLQKFFKLEAERGYDNKAVLGGLERMLAPWEAEARADSLPEELIQAIVARLRDYHRLSTTSRQEALQGLWNRIQRETETLPPPTPTEAVEPAPTKPKKTAAPRSKPQPPGDGLKPAPISRPSEPKQGFTEATPAPDSPPAALNAPITVLPGVGPRHAQTLSRLGLKSLGSMLYFFPRRYDDYSLLKQINRLRYGEEVTVIGTLDSITTRPIRSGRASITEAILNDGSGTLRVTWFNQPWIAKRLRKDIQVVLAGKIDQYLGRLLINNPDWEPLEQQNLHTNRIVPVYPLTANITQRWLRRLLYDVVTYWAPRVQDPLPNGLRRQAQLVDLPTALLQSHFPHSWEQLKAARYRLAFDEIFLLQLGLFQQKRTWQDRTARVFDTPEDWLQAQVSRLPFVLTNAQRNALQDLRADLASGRPMNRLLQGDVGSGKTVVAALTTAMVNRYGAQAVVMAPTTILAEQHHNNLRRLLAIEQGVLKESEIRLLVGSTPDAEKRDIREGLAGGEIKLVVGTHALIEDPVTFADLQLAIIDEQHRFGVEQRAGLRNKGEDPHLLVMTATPIPRSLTLTIYGDLDLTVIDEMPPGRQPVATYLLSPLERERAYSLIRNQIKQSHQAFIIYPLIEEGSEFSPFVAETNGRGAVEEHQRLQEEVFPEFRLGLLHGRMRPEEKEEVMAHFRDAKYQLLVSTSVVEVGVDVPNATVMLIEGANRFGLAQLHQFRGRVGRGQDKAYCLLIPESSDAMENERLTAMVETNDGFELAERDLVQRGPGDFLGTRQAGFTELRLANLADVQLIEKARRIARSLFDQDPDLGFPEHRLLAESVERFWSGRGDGSGDIS